ncbi:MAG: metal-sensitive transcriptional regulator [Gemmatimonadota bacterium]|nr:metal-sensitive transcriptional regulator [Gemmatimonadota bacterium]
MARATKEAGHGYQRSGRKETLKNRLRRIEGQVRGLQKMLDEERYCVEILTQIDAASAALARVQDRILESHINHCVADALEEGAELSERREKVDEIVDLLKKFRRR